MAKEKKTYQIDVDYEYGPVEMYYVEASSTREARAKAKQLYVRNYFKKSLMKTYIYGVDD
jgi:hypothetical protein